MRVLFIHNRYKFAGGEDVAVEMESSILQSYGHAVETLIFDNTEISGFVSKIKTGISSIYNRESAARVKACIKVFNPDVIHVHNLFFLASPSVLYAAKKSGIPVVFTLHNYRLICANALLLRENKVCELCVNQTYPTAGIRYKCYRNSVPETALVTAVTSIHKFRNTWNEQVDKYIALTEFGRTRFENSSLKATKGKIQVKPNFIRDPGEGQHEREPFYLFVGRLSVEKGVEVMLNAFSGMPNREIRIVGEGPLEESLKHKFSQYSNIRFEGRKQKDEVLDLMKKAKALIFPSIWYEGLPYTILEAFATGTPVIASRLGAMADMIGHNFNGYHFTAGDSADLQSSIELFESDDSSKTFYKQARETYLNKYHPDIHYKTIMEIYTNLILKPCNKG